MCLRSRFVLTDRHLSNLRIYLLLSYQPNLVGDLQYETGVNEIADKELNCSTLTFHLMSDSLVLLTQSELHCHSSPE